MSKTVLASSAAIVFTLCLAATLRAQGPGGRGPDGPPPGDGPHGHGRMRGGPPPLDRLLDLNETQKATFQSLHKEHREAVHPILEEQKKLGDELRQALDAARPDASTVGQKMIAMQAVRKKLEASREQFEKSVEGILDETQKQKFQMLREMHKDMRPGGPHPGGRGPRHEGRAQREQQ